MPRLSAFAALAMALAFGSEAMAAITTPVKTSAGLMSGVPGRDSSVTVYKGVPYAAPPVGNLRWRPPAPAPAWTGTRKADTFGAICPQTPKAGLTMSEDCLTLNVWTGAASPQEKRPVFVFLHVFLNDYGSKPEFDGENLAKKGVIVVTLNYRIGALGFLATPELSRESGHNASGDYGVMDQIAALKWVKANIAAFGGDPSRVTLSGMSSQRGSSVAYLSVSPQAKGLFQRAISGSHYPIPAALDPAPTGPAATTLKVAEADGAAYQTSKGVATLAEMRALSWEKIMEGADAPATATTPRRTFQPIVDGWVVPVSYNDPVAATLHEDAVFVTGNNLSEGGVRSEAQLAAARSAGPDPRGRSEPKLTLASYAAWAKQKFGPDLQEFLSLYPASTDDEVARQNNTIIPEYARSATYFWTARWKHQSGARPAYTYFWTYVGDGLGGGGAGHGSELVYVFDNLQTTGRPVSEKDAKVADMMSSYWVNLIKTGDPNGPGLPAWPAFDPKSPTVMELGGHFGSMPVTTPEKLALWRKTYEAGR